MSNQVQPVNIYPSPNVIQPQQQQQQQQQSSSHHSNGSFGPVFIVLAVIFVLAIIATILGRICSRRRGNKAEQQPHHGHGGGGGGKKKAKSTARPHDHKPQSGPEGDIEFGFNEKRIPTSKVAANNGDPRGPNKMPSISHNGEHKGHVRFNDDHIEFRPGH